MPPAAMLIAATLGLVAAAGCKSDDLLAEIPDAAAPDAEVCPYPTVFLNRAPTAFIAGQGSDSVTNETPILPGSMTTMGTSMGDGAWQDMVVCVGELLAPFGVVVTDADPGAVDHVEVVFTDDDPQDLFGSTLGSIAPAACDQESLRRGISFVFAGLYSGQSRPICEQAAWTVGIIAGADVSYECTDIMSLLAGCGDKTFVDGDFSCGDFEVRECRCTGEPSQNTYQILTDWFGVYCDGGAQ